MHGFEEKMVRHCEEQAHAGTDGTAAAPPAEAGTKQKKKKKTKQPPAESAAVGLRVPLTPGDVAFLVEEVYHGRSVVSGLPTRPTLVRWQRPSGSEPGQPGAVEALMDRVRPAPADLDGDTPLQPEQRASRLRLSGLVCMTREEASRHQETVLLQGQPATSLYDAATLARIEARRKEAAAYEEYRM